MIFVVSAIIFLLNLPFGFWRSRVKKFSVKWFLAVHSPVPVIYIVRVYSGLGWTFMTFPLFVGAFFFGQYLGGKLPLLKKEA